MYTLRVPSAVQRILVCDRNSEVREHLFDLLPNVTGCECEEAAVDFLFHYDVDLILLNNFPHVAQFLRDNGSLGENVVLHGEDRAASVELATVLPMARIMPVHSFRVVIDAGQKPITTPARKWALTRDDKKFLKDCGIKW